MRQRLEAKIKVARREDSQLSELQKGAMKRKLPKKYNKLSMSEALETAKQQLTSQATKLRRYTREAEASSVNKMFFTEPSKVYFSGRAIR